MDLYTIINFVHSLLRWLIFITLSGSIVIAARTFQTKSAPRKGKFMFLLTLILAHTQFLLGMILYFISPKVVFTGDTMKNDVFRFFTVEHSLGMIISIVLITIGYIRNKKAIVSGKSPVSIFVYYLIALILILVSIPWPFRNLGAGWI